MHRTGPDDLHNKPDESRVIAGALVMPSRRSAP